MLPGPCSSVLTALWAHTISALHCGTCYERRQQTPQSFCCLAAQGSDGCRHKLVWELRRQRQSTNGITIIVHFLRQNPEAAAAPTGCRIALPMRWSPLVPATAETADDALPTVRVGEGRGETEGTQP